MSDEAPIEIVPYELSWPNLFSQEREVLARALENWLIGTIEHFGSTAVPGLAAKPVIDIMAGVESSRSLTSGYSCSGTVWLPLLSVPAGSRSLVL